MDSILKKVWIFLLIFTGMGLVALVPFDKYQRAYMKEIHKVKSAPQKRVDAAYTYVEKVESGEIGETSEQNPPQVKKRIRYVQPNPRHRKPIYIRDKNNPKILHPYRG